MDTAVDTGSGFDLGAELDSALSTPVSTESEPIVETPAAEPVEESPVEDAPEAVEAEPEPEPAKDPAATEDKPAEELPEGVEVKDRGDGKKTYTVRETQFNKLITSDRTLRTIEESIGEPLTQELFQNLHEAKLAEERMYTDFISGDPQRLGAATFEYFRSLADVAMKNGEVGHNPFAQMVLQMPEYLRQADPQGYQAQASIYGRNIVDGLYQRAQNEGNEDLLRAAQWVDKALFNSYKKAEQLAAQKVDPLAQREAAITQREQQIQQQQQQEATKRWNGFLEATNSGVQAARSEEIDATLAPIKDAYKEFPEVFEGYKERLNSIARDTLNKDQRFLDYRNSVFAKSQAAVSEQVRQQLKADYLTRYRAKLKSALSPATNPAVKKMLDQGAAAVKAQADTNRQRLAAAASRREPGGGGATKQNSVLPARTPNGGRFASVDDIQNEMDALLA